MYEQWRSLRDEIGSMDDNWRQHDHYLLSLAFALANSGHDFLIVIAQMRSHEKVNVLGELSIDTIYKYICQAVLQFRAKYEEYPSGKSARNRTWLLELQRAIVVAIWLCESVDEVVSKVRVLEDQGGLHEVHDKVLLAKCNLASVY
ncbi:hypothetical protein CL634_09065 [bacterium]|nr:hypothetical protein [bacterium]|tara:strand:+ start:2176 stop:2613 length:438 start_codon:yes stop_codon:yes gene_type:complete